MGSKCLPCYTTVIYSKEYVQVSPNGKTDLRTIIKKLQTFNILVVSVTQSCLTLCDPMDCSPPDSSLLGINSPGKNNGVGSHSLLQEIFLMQRWSSSPLHCRQIILGHANLKKRTAFAEQYLRSRQKIAL